MDDHSALIAQEMLTPIIYLFPNYIFTHRLCNLKVKCSYQHLCCPASNNSYPQSDVFLFSFVVHVSSFEMLVYDRRLS